MQQTLMLHSDFPLGWQPRKRAVSRQGGMVPGGGGGGWQPTCTILPVDWSRTL